MANFTRKHYVSVAHVLRTNLNQHSYNGSKDIDEIECDGAIRVAIKDMALDFHNLFRLDNPLYNADKFMEACGIDDWQDMNQVEDWDLQPYKNRKGVDA